MPTPLPNRSHFSADGVFALAAGMNGVIPSGIPDAKAVVYRLGTDAGFGGSRRRAKIQPVSDGSIAGIHDRVVEHGREFEGGS